MPEHEVALTGSCLCGSIAYRIRGNILHFNHCHCERCRKATGTGHASNIIAESVSVSWTAGETLLERYEVPVAKRFATVFCRRCGSPMPRISHDGRIAVIPAGSLDGDPGLRPERRIFIDSRVAWSCSDDLPGFAQYPPRD